MKLRWVLALVIIFALFYILVFGSSFDRGLSELRGIESRAGVSQSALAPGTKEELADYREGLALLKRKYIGAQDFSRLLDLKISLAGVTEMLFFLEDEFETINKVSPNCSPKGEVEVLKKKAADIKKAFSSLSAKRDSFMQNFSSQAQKAPEISGESFKQTMNGAIAGVNRIVGILESYCSYV